MNTLTVKDKATPLLQALGSIKDSGRVLIMANVGEAVQKKVRDHVIGEALVRHSTADKLGAAPSDILTQAAEQIGSPDALAIDGWTASLSIANPAMSRAFRDIDILPKGHPFLTIAANAAAYNNRFQIGVAERARFNEAGELLPPKVDGAPVYLFVKEVHQKQDRSLLPSDNQLNAAGVRGVEAGLTAILQEAKVAA